MATNRVALAPGTALDEVYASGLPKWRYIIRRVAVNRIQVESKSIAKWQKLLRSPLLDSWFRFSALLGTTSFFVASVPLFFLFGHAASGRGLLHVLSAGGYLSSLVKDLICAPRPYSPPVVRLSTAFHHLEYGFPSTHSTNSVSAALYLYSVAHLAFASSSFQNSLVAINALLVLYAGSVVLGRIYCGMHSISDCIAGAILGTFTWAIQMRYGAQFEFWMSNGGLSVPIVVLTIWIFLISQHPSTVDRCLCFDDAISCLSALAGTTIGRWCRAALHFPFSPHQPPPDNLMSNHIFGQALFEPIRVVLKIVLTVGTLMLWRLTIKAILPRVLSAVSQTSHSFTEPPGNGNAKEVQGNKPSLDPVPSVVDLQIPHSSDGQLSSSYGNYELSKGKASYRFKTSEVFVKMTVYFGIGWLGSEIIPGSFEYLGW